ncbi:MAG TPA: hypothetical protein VF401_01975 [Candidatus Saccharimonadales bacterium]
MTETHTTAHNLEPQYNNYLQTLQRYEDPFRTFHPIGVRDQQQFEAYQSDPGTVSLQGVPSLVPLESASNMVEVARVLENVRKIDPQAKDNHILVGIVPAQFIAEHIEEAGQSVGGGKTFVLCEYDTDTPATEVLQDQAIRARLHPLLHPITQSEAALNFFEATGTVLTDYRLQPTVRLKTVIEEQRVPPVDTQEDGGTINLRLGGSFSDDEKSQIWELFRQRFTDISDNLPVRLEEDEASTMELLEDPRYGFSYRLEPDGRISCVALFTLEREAYPWINPEFLDTRSSMLKQKPSTKNALEIFVPGVAAYQREGLQASEAVMRKIVDACAASGASALAFRFECTDVSSRYIPRLAGSAIAHNTHTQLLQTQLLAQKEYAVLELN